MELRSLALWPWKWRLVFFNFHHRALFQEERILFIMRNNNNKGYDSTLLCLAFLSFGEVDLYKVLRDDIGSILTVKYTFLSKLSSNQALWSEETRESMRLLIATHGRYFGLHAKLRANRRDATLDIFSREPDKNAFLNEYCKNFDHQYARRNFTRENNLL